MFYFTHEIFKPFTWSLRGITTSHFIYILNLNFILQTNCWTYNFFLKSLSNLRRQIISDLTHAYTQVNAE